MNDISIVSISSSVLDRATRLSQNVNQEVLLITQRPEFLNTVVAERDLVVTTRDVAINLLKKAQVQANFKAIFYSPLFFTIIGTITDLIGKGALQNRRDDKDSGLSNLIKTLAIAAVCFGTILVLAGSYDMGPNRSSLGLRASEAIWSQVSCLYDRAIQTIQTLPNPDSYVVLRFTNETVLI